MNEIKHCERGEDLVSFLYGEASDREAADFQLHLQKCSTCATELAGFGQIHESMVDWRDEMLAGFVSTPVPAPLRRKSALAALREFFDLSPLWLKGAVGFATVLLLAFALVGVSRMGSKPTQTVATQSDAKYTEAQFQQRLARAQEDWKAANQTAVETEKSEKSETSETPGKATPKPAVKVVKYAPTPNRGRSPLSKSEREQLAADLRLSSDDEDEQLNLLGDRINNQF